METRLLVPIMLAGAIYAVYLNLDNIVGLL